MKNKKDEKLNVSAEKTDAVSPSTKGFLETPTLAVASAANVETARKKRSDSGQSRGRKRISEEEAALLANFEALYTPEAWEGIMCSPADGMLAITGNKRWDLSQNERKTLGIHASMAARCFAITNPKWLALSMLLISITTVYGGRSMMELSERKKLRDAKKNVPPVKTSV